MIVLATLLHSANSERVKVNIFNHILLKLSVKYYYCFVFVIFTVDAGSQGQAEKRPLKISALN